MSVQYAMSGLPARFRPGGCGWSLGAMVLAAWLFGGLSALQGSANDATILPGRNKPLPIARWRPSLVLKLNATPFRTSDASFGPGLAWVNDGKMLAAATNQGLVVWRLTHKQASLAKLVIYRRAGISQFTPLKPMGIIQRRGSFGVALFVKGENGANPRLVVDWYARKNVKFLRGYRIHLRRVRNSGVGIVAPMDANWFATIPIAAIPRSRICLWNDRDGKQLQVHLPPLRHRFNFAFSGGRGNELVWGTPGIGIRVARWRASPAARVGISYLPFDRMQIQDELRRQRQEALVRIEDQLKSKNAGMSKQSLLRRARAVEWSNDEIAPLETWLGTISPNGTQMLLMEMHVTGRAPYGCGVVNIVASSILGIRPSERTRYLPPGCIRAYPVFSASARFAAFAVLGGFPRRGHGWTAATDIFLIRDGRLEFVRWARLPDVVPVALSFSGRGRRLAVVTNLQIFVFDLPRNNSGARPGGLPFSKVRHAPEVVPHPFNSIKH